MFSATIADQLDLYLLELAGLPPKRVFLTAFGHYVFVRR
jgi:hypothetical protein